MVSTETTLVRPSLTGALIEAVRERILHRRLSAERPLVEADLAAELGVSRTPLREALIALEGEGFVARIPNLGFFVVPLSIVEAEEIYPLVGALEGMALRSQGAVDTEMLARLGARNENLLSHGLEPEELLRLDGDWHDLLLLRYRNGKLRDLLGRLKNQLKRYEYAFMAEAGSVATSVRDHVKILSALQRGDLQRAALLLEEHWQAGVPAVVEWMRRTQKEGQGET